MNRILTSLLTIVLFSGCEFNSSFTVPAPLSEDFKEVIIVIKDNLGAQKVAAQIVADSDQKEQSPRLLLTFRNCEHLSIDDEKIDEYIDQIFFEILQNIQRADLPVRLEISIQEDWGFTEIYKQSYSETYSKEALLTYYEHFHSPLYLQQQTLQNLLDSKNYQGLSLLADSLISENPFSELAHQYLGMGAFHILHDTVGALQHFENALQHDDNNIVTLENIGILHYHLKSPHQALSFITAAIKVDSSRVNSVYHRGLIYLELGDTSSACRDFHYAKKLGSHENPMTFLYCP